MPAQDLRNLKEAFQPYDVTNLVAKIGSLQLLPVNASHAIRLEGVASAAGGNTANKNRPHISKRHLRDILNRHVGPGCPLSLEEDPCENEFTEGFTFHGGSYTIFPGILENPTFLLRNFIKGLFLPMQPFPNEPLREQIKSLIVGVLGLSNEIVGRAHLERGIAPGQDTGNKELEMPSGMGWLDLQNAVSFTDEELEDLFRKYRLGKSAIDCLITQSGTIFSDVYNPSGSQLLKTPVFRVADNNIVATPGLLLAALFHHIIRLSIENNANRDLTMAFQNALWDTIRETLEVWDAYPVTHPDWSALDDGAIKDGLFRLDTDKLLYVQLLSDDLGGFDIAKPFARWDVADLPERLRQRHDNVIDYLFRGDQRPNDILSLLSIQTMGRPVGFALQKPRPGYDVPWISLSPADLEVFVSLERQDPLALWKFVRQKQCIREKVEVHTSGELDEFGIYRARHYSYYLSDEALPSVIAIGPGPAGELKREDINKQDRHGVPSHRRGFAIEVSRLGFYGPEVPIYAPVYVSFDRDQTTILIEGLPVPVWVVGQDYSTRPERELSHFYFLLADAIAFWLWQFTPSLERTLEPLKKQLDRIVFQISLNSPEDWKMALIDTPMDSSGSSSHHCSYSINSQEATVTLAIESTIMSLFRRPDNQGEREMMLTALNALRDLLKQLSVPTANDLNEKAASSIIDANAPLGLKKKIVIVDPNRNPILGDEPTVTFRKVQEADQHQLLDEIGDHLKSMGYNPEPIPELKRTELLNGGVVKYLYERLEHLIATLNPDGLLEWLITFNESIVKELYFRRLTIPTRLACFFSEEAMRQTLIKDIPEVDRAATASRFLVEYVASKPPSGLRPISLEIYDSLMALSLQIINWGSTSDLIHFGIADIQLSILPSGRLGSNRDVFADSLGQFLRDFSTSEIRRASSSFLSTWPGLTVGVVEDETAPNEKKDEFEEAFTSEFGFSDREFAVLSGQIYALGQDQEEPAKSAPYERLTELLQQNTGISRDKIIGFIDLFSLEPRPDFLNPGPKYRSEDTYPWRFNRALSFIRRPLIRIPGQNGGMVMWGNRHSFSSMAYLVNLCLSGKLKARTQAMKSFIGKTRNRQGRLFNGDVYDEFSCLSNVIAKERVDRFGKAILRDDHGDLGDIDVFAIHTLNKQVLVIECKDFDLARTPHEMAKELSDLFQGKKSKESAVKRVQRRSNWIRENIKLVTQYLNIPAAGDWKVFPIIVVSQELITPYMRKSPVIILSLRQLSEEFIPNWK